MRIYFDTSSLFKLYHQEDGTEPLLEYMNQSKPDQLVISNLALLEFSSVVWRKVRKGDLKEEIAQKLLHFFSQDCMSFEVINISDEIMLKAHTLLGKYGKSGLRALDSLQLSTACMVGVGADVFLCHDKLLNGFMKLEDLAVHTF